MGLGRWKSATSITIAYVVIRELKHKKGFKYYLFKDINIIYYKDINIIPAL